MINGITVKRTARDPKIPQENDDPKI